MVMGGKTGSLRRSRLQSAVRTDCTAEIGSHIFVLGNNFVPLSHVLLEFVKQYLSFFDISGVCVYVPSTALDV